MKTERDEWGACSTCDGRRKCGAACYQKIVGTCVELCCWCDVCQTHSSLQSAPLQSTPTLLVLLKEPKTPLTMWENVRKWFGTAAHAFAGRPKQGTLHAAHTAKQLPWVHRHIMNADITVCVLLVATVCLAAALVIVCITWRRERERHKKQHSLLATLQRIPPPTQAFTESPTETVIARGM